MTLLRRSCFCTCLAFSIALCGCHAQDLVDMFTPNTGETTGHSRLGAEPYPAYGAVGQYHNSNGDNWERRYENP